MGEIVNEKMQMGAGVAYNLRVVFFGGLQSDDRRPPTVDR